jgi:hypothetical protein
VFAIPGLQTARYEEVELPANDFRRLRVEVAPGPDEPERVAIADAWVPGQGRRPVRETVLEPRFTRAEDTEHRESWLVLDLGAAHQPFHAIELRVTDARFLREAWVEARRDAGPGAPRGRPKCGSCSGEASSTGSTTADGRTSASASRSRAASARCACASRTGTTGRSA